jgi:hypothetical protein
MDEVMDNLSSPQGCGVHFETWVQVDEALRDNDGTLCLNSPPLMPVTQIESACLAHFFKKITSMYLDPIKALFPPEAIDSDYMADFRRIRPEEKTTLVLFAEILESQFAAYPFTYKGTVLKPMWSHIYDGVECPFVQVPEHLQSQANEYEAEVLKLPFVVSTESILLPTWEEATAALVHTLSKYPEHYHRCRALGFAAGVAMARSQAANHKRHQI